MTEKAIEEKTKGTAKEEASAVFAWIPCSQRLPELHRETSETEGIDFYISDHVLVTGRRKLEPYDSDPPITVAQYEVDAPGSPGEWFTSFEMDSLDVTAWMPLPAPYAEKEVRPDCPWR